MVLQEETAYSIIKLQEIGDNLHVVIKMGLEYEHFIDDVSNTSREDQQRNLMLLKLVKKPCASIPTTTTKNRKEDSETFHATICTCSSMK